MEHFDEFEPKVAPIEDNRIIQMVLTNPKKAFEFIHHYRYEIYMKPLLALAGMASAFDRAVNNSSGDHMSLVGVIFMSVLMGGLLGWISLYIFAALISWTGSWLKGKAKTDDVLRIIAYAYIPSILTMAVMILQIVVLGNAYFQSTTDISSYDLLTQIIIYGCTIIQGALAVWTLVLMVIGVAEAQEFSWSKALLNLFLPVLIIAVPILVIIQMTA